MNNFFVISNVNRDPECKVAQFITDYLVKKGKSCRYIGIERDDYEDSEAFKSINEIDDNTECVIVLGGDGTIIQISGVLAKKQLPLIGVNLGNLGFLAEVDKDKITPALDRLILDDFFYEDRMMLSGTVVINGCEIDSKYAFNDIVVKSRGNKVGYFDLDVNGRRLTSFAGDGIIIATPTGSTAYSMSAGGAVVEPSSQLILITPICPLKGVSRSIVLSAEDTVTIKVPRPSTKRRNKVTAFFDGGENFDLMPGDEVIINRATESVRFIKFSKESFLDVLARKMS